MWVKEGREHPCPCNGRLQEGETWEGEAGCGRQKPEACARVCCPALPAKESLNPYQGIATLSSPKTVDLDVLCYLLEARRKKNYAKKEKNKLRSCYLV